MVQVSVRQPSWKNGWTDRHAIWVGPTNHALEVHDDATCPGEYDRMTRAWRQCGFMSDYLDHLLFTFCSLCTTCIPDAWRYRQSKDRIFTIITQAISAFALPCKPQYHNTNPAFFSLKCSFLLCRTSASWAWLFPSRWLAIYTNAFTTMTKLRQRHQSHYDTKITRNRQMQMLYDTSDLTLCSWNTITD